jgi:GT2 family glycosyltransferase
MHGPLVSVVIPAYNAAAYIPEALQSVFAQTYSDFEVVVVNDGSPDTPALEAALKPFGDRIIYFKQENRGPSAARNLGIQRGRGEFVAFIDSDDIWLPEYLAEQMQLFAAQPALDVVGADMSTYGNADVHPTTLTTRPGSGQENISLKDLLLLDYVLLPSCTVARHSALLGAGLFDETIVRGEDWDLWLRIAHKGGRIVARRRVLGLRRVHAGGLTRAAWETLKDEIRVLNKWKETAGIPPDIRELLDQKLAQVNAYVDLAEGKKLLRGGDALGARAALERAYRFFGRTDVEERAMSTGPVSNGLMHSFVRRNKLRALLLGLRYFPGLTALAMKARPRVSYSGSAF